MAVGVDRSSAHTSSCPNPDLDMGLFDVNANLNVWFLTYLTYDADKIEAGDDEGRRDVSPADDAALIAIDYETGKVEWKQDYGNASGVLKTAGMLLFAWNSNYPVAVDPATAEVNGPVSNAPMTYSLDGRQYAVMAVGDTLYALSAP